MALRVPVRPDAAFRAEVLRHVAAIPRGRLATYGQIALMCGHPRRPRQVGMILKGLPEDTDLPWHRVVNAQGRVSARSRWWGAMIQIQRLRSEGVPVSDDGAVPLSGRVWDGRFPVDA
jgi:methylated-DNA-protein-cysteine methyltransferase-like protein